MRKQYTSLLFALSSKYNETVAEPGVSPLNSAEETLWRTLAHLLVALPRALEEDLYRETGLTLTEYGVLMNLSEAPGRQLRMSVLAGCCDLSGSRMTRLVEDLRQKGFVTKDRSSEDGRGNVAQLTEAGFARLNDAYPAHLASVRRRVLDSIQPDELERLGAPLERIAAALDSFPCPSVSDQS